ncbi:MAG: hypothetical protein NWR72_04675 [Bacteroidia bacterium]|nr:hypothetical protein [Bacteroidia bacterium]
MRAAIFLLLLPIFGGAHHAHAETKEQHRAVETALVGLRFQEATELLASFSSAPYRAFYQSNLALYRAMSSMDPELRESYRNGWENHVDQLEDMAEQDNLKEILLADVCAKRAMVEILDHNYLSSVIYARSARKYLDLSFSKYGRLNDQLKLEGFFEVILGSLPKKYQWITRSLGLRGDLQKGLRYLRTAAAQSQLFNGECQLLLALVEKNVLNRPEQTLFRLEQYQQKLPTSSILIDFFLASGYQSIKQNEKSLRVLSKKAHYEAQGVFILPFWDYMLGKGSYFKGDYAAARVALSHFLSQYKGALFRTDANFRLGMAYTLNGQYDQGKKYFSTIVNRGSEENFDEDSYAAAMATLFLTQAPGPVSLQLFKARNAFDGGYLDLASSLLDQTRQQYALRPTELVEWYYRRARIHHSNGNMALAAADYERSINYTADAYTSWLHAYASFYRGDIAAESGQKETAREWYQKALSYDGYFYQSGLENRCKAAISQLDRSLPQASSNRR